MLNDAESSAQPTKYAQNNRHGMYLGTMGRTIPTSARCRAPKTAKGTAKHRLLKATILSRPRARAKSSFAAHRAIRKTRMPAEHIETGVREITKNEARMVVCMWRPSVRGLDLGARLSKAMRFRIVQRVSEDVPRCADRGLPALGFRGPVS